MNSNLADQGAGSFFSDMNVIKMDKVLYEKNFGCIYGSVKNI